MTNFEKIKNELENLEETYPICYIAVHKLGLSRNDGECGDTCCQKCEKEAFKWLLEENKEPILTEKEKAYLKNVIEPRKDEIVYIKKTGFYKSMKADCCCVSVYTKNPFCNKDNLFISANTPWTLLEFLTTEDMPFEGMAINKRYTLEELGL